MPIAKAKNVAVFGPAMVLQQLSHDNAPQADGPCIPLDFAHRLNSVVAGLTETQDPPLRRNGASHVEQRRHRRRIVREINEDLDIVEFVNIAAAGVFVLLHRDQARADILE